MHKTTLRIFVAAALALAAGCSIDHARETAIYRDILTQRMPATRPVLGEAVTLQQLMTLANLTDEQLSISGEDYLQAIIERQRTVYSFLPSVELNPSFQIQKPNGNSSTSTGAGGSVIVSSSAKNTRFDLPARLSWLLFDMKRFSTLRQQAAAIEQQKQLLLDLQDTLLLTVAQTYYQVLSGEEQVRVLENSLALQEARLHDAEAKLKAGTGRQLDVAQAQAQASTTRGLLIDARNAVVTAREALTFFISQDIGDRALIDSYETPANIRDLEGILHAAYESRNDLRAAEAGLESAKQGVQVAYDEYYPNLSAAANYFLYSEISTVKDQWSIVFSSVIPIFSAGSIESDVRAAWSRFRQAKLSLERLQREVARDVTINYRNFDASSQRLPELEVEVRAAADQLRLTQRQGVVGSATPLEILIAQDTFLNARLQQTNEVFNHKILYLDLMRSIGRMPRIANEPYTGPMTRPVMSGAVRATTGPATLPAGTTRATSRPGSLPPAPPPATPGVLGGESR